MEQSFQSYQVGEVGYLVVSKSPEKKEMWRWGRDTPRDNKMHLMTMCLGLDSIRSLVFLHSCVLAFLHSCINCTCEDWADLAVEGR